jgi:peptidoglycan hydrolase-like protein with peptidoglycan-binding domain
MIHWGDRGKNITRTKWAAGALLLCCVFSGCDALYRVLDKEGAEEKRLIGEVVLYESNPVVEETQTLLYLYGYNTGEADGMLGLRTRNAIEKFQKDNGLEPSRFLDKATWERLNVFKENKLIIDRQLNILLVQKLLKAAGFEAGGMDGKMGDKTKAAVLKFQEAHGLKADGKIGYQTLGKLAGYLTEEMQGFE